MTLLIPEVLGLGIGMIMSPGLLAITIFLLSKKKNNMLGSSVFLAGNILTLIILICLGLFVGTTLHSNQGGSFQKNIDLIIGIIFLLFGLKTIFSKGEKIKKEHSLRLSLWFGLGFLFSITNLDADTLFLVAMREIVHSSAIIFEQIILIFYCSLMIVLPIILPMFIYHFFPDKSKRILEKINHPVQKYGRYFIILIFLLFGIWFLLKGFGITL